MKRITSVELFFQEGSSDKLYCASIVAVGPDKYDVLVEWGRRGAKLNQGKKAIAVALAAAERTLDRLVREKTGKGYERVSADVKPAAQAPPEGSGSGSKVTGRRARVGHVAQLLNAVDEDGVPRLMKDDAIVAQQKLDGTRILVHVMEEIFATNRAGQATTVPAAVLEGLAHLPQGTVVDGELVAEGGAPTLWLFDLLALAGEDLKELGYLERFERLDGDVEPGLFGPTRVLPVARTAAEKKRLFAALVAAQAEGIVFKRHDAPYSAGRPASGGTQLKHKFVKSADVALVENAGNAYRMVVYDGKKPFDVGKVFAGTTNESRKKLDGLLAEGKEPIVEVRYLYATDDEQLFQPVFVRIRTDKKRSECTRAHLARTNRRVIADLPR